jgi:hypothetical protein
MYVLPFPTTSVGNDKYLTSYVRDTHVGVHVKWPLSFSDFKINWNVWTDLSKISQ